MSKDKLGYLSPEEQQSVGVLVAGLESLKERYPSLTQVDLVIEGGVGTGRIMRHIARRFFPNALYVGTDISEMLAGSRRRQSKGIDENAWQRVLRANEYPDLGVEGAILYGSCFDGELIRDIANKAGRQHVFLASYNALNALIGHDMNPWDKKDEDDIVSIPDIVRSDSPYMGQLHIIAGDLWGEEEPTTMVESNYRRLELAGQTAGWTTDRIANGLLLLRAA